MKIRAEIILRRIVPALAALGMGALPAGARAQNVIAHALTYTASSAAAPAKPPGTNMPMVTPSQVPAAMLQSYNTLPSGAYALTPSVVMGSTDGVHRDKNPDLLAKSDAYGSYAEPGQSIAPYTTARASASVLGTTTTAATVAVVSFPWRATGQLHFMIGSDPYICTASLIGPGMLVTAAHCVYEFGAGTPAGFHSNYVFVPAQNTLGAPPPYGAFTPTGAFIAPAYYNGTDSCIQKGIVCSNDIAILTLAPDANGNLPGNLLGYYGYASDGYGFIPSYGGASLASITQLGYPGAFDSASMMERTDGVGSYWSPDGATRQILLGTAQTGGSSGGPWLVNFGAPPTLTTAASLGSAAAPNMVVGVTGWGVNAVGSNLQGASLFGTNTQFPKASYADSKGINRGAGNIGALVAGACSYSPSSC